jgi:hypothetical protein
MIRIQGTTTDEYSALERDATAHARGTRGVSAGIYVRESVSRVTPERAVAEALENDPSVYAAYRNAHNSAGVIQTLQAAGVRIG